MSTKPNDLLPVLQKEMSPILSRVESFVVSDEETKTEASEMLSQLNKFNDKVVADREKITKPLNATLKEVRGRYKPTETMLDTAIGLIRSKLTQYQTQKQKVADEEARRIAERVGEGRGHFRPETAIEKIAGLDTPVKEVETNSGSVRFDTVKVFKVVDLKALPVEYLLPNETEIRKAMQKGIEIKGVEYSTEQRPVNSR